MLLEQTINLNVTDIVTGAHVLLGVGLLRYPRDGRARGEAVVRLIPDNEMEPETKPLPRRSTKGRPASQGDVVICHRQAFTFGESAVLNFDEQREALGGDLRYVVALASTHC
jgi:hypothetical protein